jgi:tetratricopeptide (TPR) repeat protein
MQAKQKKSRARKTRSPKTQSTDIRAYADRMLELLAKGDASLKQVVGLSDAEMNAVSRRAHAFRRAGQMDEAMALFGLLLTFDPFDGARWSLMAGLKQRTGDSLAALSCYQVALTLGHQDAELLSRQAALQKTLETQFARAKMPL